MATSKQAKEGQLTVLTWALILLMVFASGFAGLVYQLLWVKQLGLLFGNTAQAASATLGVFFAGLGIGSWWWGKRLQKTRVLRTYAILEGCIAITALTYFALIQLFYAIYPTIYNLPVGTSVGFILKLTLAAFLVFPPAFFMGGTVPAIGQAVIRQAEQFGSLSALLYGVNTLGAAAGVLSAAFYLIPSFGFPVTYGIAIGLSVGTCIIAWILSKNEKVTKSAEVGPKEVVESSKARKEKMSLAVLCFFSGFIVLGLEVIWTRVFAQVHENSVYSYTAILVVVLICLAIGAGLSSLISKITQQGIPILAFLTFCGGILLVFNPEMIIKATDGLAPVQTIESWDKYIGGLFKTTFLCIGFTVILLGMVFPFLMKLAEKDRASSGVKLGRLLALNTAGAICGSLCAGFILLPLLGMWDSIRLLATLYLIVSIFLPLGKNQLSLIYRSVCILMVALTFTVLPRSLPVVTLPSTQNSAEILETWERVDGTVAVIEEKSGHRSIRLNGGYGLGSTKAYLEQWDQARIPLYLFPETKSICFIGLGTGMSAGASLGKEFPNVEKVVTCELSKSVIEAAEKWIPKAMTKGVFDDPRSTILTEDGRHFLSVTRERFDMINADLFLPYRRGTGSLYSRDYYEIVTKRLNPDGAFVQWLPLYQLTEDEFGIIARTMLEVFPEVSMWRNNFSPGQEKVALIGRLKKGGITLPKVTKNLKMQNAVNSLQWWSTSPDMVRVKPETVPLLYIGNLTVARELFQSYPINTDAHPIIEYQTPKNFREVAAQDKVIWCVGPKLIAWVDRIIDESPLENDPAFANYSATHQHFTKAGKAFHQAMVRKALNDTIGAEKNWDDFIYHWKKATN